MPDFRTLVRRHITPLALPDDTEQKVIDEWAAQLEDIYDALCAAGASEDEAWSDISRQVREAGPPDGLLPLHPLPSANAHVRSAATRVRRALSDGAWRDLRGSVRLLLRQPAFSATVILTLAICLGANAAIFTVVHDVLLKPLPVPEPERIVGLGDVYPTITPNDILSNDVPSYFDRLQALTTLEDQGLFTFWFDAVALDGVPRELRGMRVTPSLFHVLRVPPALGRAFSDDEGEIGNDKKIILSDALWHRLYGGAPDVIGRTVRLTWTGSLYTVVGVMPPNFTFFDQGYAGHSEDAAGVQFWIPLTFTPEQKSDAGRTRYGFFHIGRLKAEATVTQVQAQLDALHAANVKRFPQFRYEELGMYSHVTPLHEALTRRVRRTLYLLWAGAGCVLLIGAINLANLALARTSERRRELATRLALGASRSQVARQLVIEAVVPAALGGVAGIAVGAALLELLATNGLTNLPNATSVQLPGATIILTVIASLVVGVITGMVPAAATGARTITQIGAGSRAVTDGHTARWFRRTLVVTQVALSVILLIGATLLFTSFRYLLNLDAGFRANGVVTATIFPPPSRYPRPQDVVALQDRLLDRVRAIPGVQAAGITSNIALSGFESPSAVSAAGREAEKQAAVVPSVVVVTPGYFETMSTPLIRGRYFAASDREDSVRVAIVDEALADRLWPGEDPIGKGLVSGDAGPSTIVGIVRAIRLEDLATSTPSIGTVYFPHSQAPPSRRLRWVVIKSGIEPPSVVRALQAALVAIDPDLPLSDIQTMDERTANSIAPQQLAMSLATLFAAVALLLSMLGLYGVLAGLVARRRREIGIRMALGDTVQGIFRLVLIEGLVLVGIGLAFGLGCAVAGARTLTGLLFGVQPTDPVLLLAVTILTGVVALLACIQPAVRATRVDPITVLTDS
jgi:putative ABC transport system permease protein